MYSNVTRSLPQPLVSRLASGLCCLLLALAPLSAYAESGGDDAREQYRRGVEAVDGSRWDEAVVHFRRSYELHSSTRTAFNLASALGQLGSVVEALEVIRTRVIEVESTRPAVLRAARQLETSLANRLATITVSIQGDSDDLRMELDGERIRNMPLDRPQPVDPGAHSLRLMRDDELVDEARFDIDEGGEDTLHLVAPPPTPQEVAVAAVVEALESTSVSAEIETTVEPRRGRWLVRQWWFWTSVAVVVVGGVTAGAVVGTQDDSPTPVGGNLTPGVIEVSQ